MGHASVKNRLSVNSEQWTVDSLRSPVVQYILAVTNSQLLTSNRELSEPFIYLQNLSYLKAWKLYANSIQKQ